MVKIENVSLGAVVQCKISGRIGEVIRLGDITYGDPTSNTGLRVEITVRFYAKDHRAAQEQTYASPKFLRSCQKHFVDGCLYEVKPVLARGNPVVFVAHTTDAPEIFLIPTSSYPLIVEQKDRATRMEMMPISALRYPAGTRPDDVNARVVSRTCEAKE